MYVTSRRPGPTGTSCLTCKRRHKKCDQRQPICERCETGDFECLGYDHIQRNQPAAHVTRSNHRQLLPKLTESEDPSSHSEVDWQGSRPTSSSDSLAQIERPKNMIYTNLLPISSNSDLNWKSSGKSTAVAGTPMSILQGILGLYTQLPYSNLGPLKDLLDGQWFIDTFIARTERVMAHWYLQPTNLQKEYFHRNTARRLSNSKFTRWVSLVGMSIIESLLEGDTSRRRLHTTWIEYIEGSLKHELALDLAPTDMRDRRSGWLQISLMKTKLIPSCNVHQLLRSITPVFLQVTYSNPILWSGSHDPTRIPLLNILASEFHELAYFVIVDCTFAMASGLPQHVEYDTTPYRRSNIFASHQWVHSSPIEFQLVLANINACRDKSLTKVRKWEDIERWLLTWQPRPGEYTFTESWMMIAWYAVQESWRLALLIYLYLAVCNASSDDPRIQSYVKQTLQVVGTLKKRGPSDTNASFFSQYLMVGICARTETQRKLVRDKLTSEKETKFWLMRSSDFVPVLDHLWRGAAADGRPVQWSDYIHSREAVLPVVL